MKYEGKYVIKDRWCHDPSLRFATRLKGMQRCRPRMQFGSHIHTPKNVEKCEGMNPHTPKWVPTLGVRFSMDFQIFKEQFERVTIHWIK